MAFHKAYIGCWLEAQYTYDDGCVLRAFAKVPLCDPSLHAKRTMQCSWYVRV